MKQTILTGVLVGIAAGFLLPTLNVFGAYLLGIGVTAIITIVAINFP